MRRIKFLARASLIVSVCLCVMTSTSYAEPQYKFWGGDDAYETPLMRVTNDDGSIYEYYNEIRVPGEGGVGGYGRLILEYNPNSPIQGETFVGYKKWDWNTLAAGNQVILQIYEGAYNPSNAVWSDVQPGERRVEYVYDYNPANPNWWQVNTTINGWIEREKRIYSSDGITIREEYLRDAAGRLIRSRKLPADADGCTSFDYSYYGSGNVSQKSGYINFDWTGINITYTYYDNSTNRMKTKLDLGANVYYEFTDEGVEGVDDPLTSADERYGNMVRQIDMSANIYYIYSYHTTPGMETVLHYRNEYRYEEADEAGILEGTITGEFIAQYEMIDTDYIVKREGPLVDGKPTGPITTLLIDIEGNSHNNTYIDPSSSDPDKKDILLVYNWDASWNIINVTKYYPDGKVEVCTPTNAQLEDPEWPLKEQIIPDSGFKKGVNLPWLFDTTPGSEWSNYGYGLGLSADDGSHSGFSKNIERLYNQMDKCKGGYVRIFLFCDFRAGMEFAPDGTPIGFTDKVYEDMQALLDCAKALGVKLMPVLFDYMLADIGGVAEHADLINDPVKRQALLDIFSDFFTVFGNDSSIYAWDIMNEPEFAWGTNIPNLQDFVQGFTDLIHTSAPDAKVTVGSRSRTAMLENWTGLDLDIYQFHYYDSMEGTDPFDYTFTEAELALLGGKPVIAGELQPSDVIAKLNILNRNGYAGGFFWQDEGGYTISDDDYRRIQDWYEGIKYGFYFSQRIGSATIPFSDGYGNNYYHYIDEDFDHNGNGTIEEDEHCGRVDMQVLASPDGEGATGYIYVYFFDGPPEPYVYDFLSGPNIANMKRCYATTDYSDPANPVFGDLLCIYVYDNLGRMVQKMYANGDFEITEYVGDTATISFVHSYGHGWVWKEALEYNPDGSLYRKWTSDADPNTPGAEVRYYEYEWDVPAVGQFTLSEYTDGSKITLLGTHVYSYTDKTDSSTWVYAGNIYYDPVDQRWHKTGNFVNTTAGPKAGTDDVYTGFDTATGTLTGFIYHAEFEYYDSGNIKVKRIYDNTGPLENAQYEKYTYNDDADNTLDTKIFYFDGASLSGNEIGEPDNKWHIYNNFTDELDDAMLHAQHDQVYSDAGLINLEYMADYTFFQSGRIETKTLDRAIAGNIRYEYLDEDFDYNHNGTIDENEHYGRIVRTQRESGSVVRTLDWYSGTEVVKKEEEYTNLSETTWNETRWYFESGKLSKKISYTGEAAEYFDVDGYKLETYWNPDGTITHWASVADFDTAGNYKCAWYYHFDNSISCYTIEVYTYYDSGRVHYKDMYKLIDDVWTWFAAGSYKDTGGFPWGSWDIWVPQSVTGASTNFTLPDKPDRSDVMISGAVEKAEAAEPYVLQTVDAVDPDTLGRADLVMQKRAPGSNSESNFSYSGELSGNPLDELEINL